MEDEADEWNESTATPEQSKGVRGESSRRGDERWMGRMASRVERQRWRERNADPNEDRDGGEQSRVESTLSDGQTDRRSVDMELGWMRVNLRVSVCVSVSVSACGVRV